MPAVRKGKLAKPSKESPVEEKEVKVAISGQIVKKIQKQQQRVKNERGVVFIKHLPHGFFEEQLKNYFEQFGNVTRLRLSRSKRTGGSKGFAFVEFEYPEVAQVAADTMDNYLMFKKVVKAAYIPPEKQHFNYFKTSLRKNKNKAGKEIFTSSKTNAIRRKVKEHNEWTDDSYQKRTVSKLRKLKQISSKYGHLGIDFSKIVVLPKKIAPGEKASNDSVASAAKTEGPSTSSNKQKKGTKGPAIAPITEKENKPIKMKDIALVDLLGNTINDDSDDEDYIVGPECEEEETSSDEETYGLAKSDSEDEQLSEDEDQPSEEESQPSEDEVALPLPKKKQKVSLGKSIKRSNVECIDRLIKRKPQTGGVQKMNRKPMKKDPVTKTKSAMLVVAAKKVAKPLPMVQKKFTKNSKPIKKQKV